MITKLYVLLSLGKCVDNTFVEGRMSTPLVSYILLGIILLVVLLRVLSWLQFLQLKRKARKRIFKNKTVKSLPVRNK